MVRSEVMGAANRWRRARASVVMRLFSDEDEQDSLRILGFLF